MAAMPPPTAVLIEDEPLPRTELRQMLATLWPELNIVAEAVDGASGLRALTERCPQVAFIDIRLPTMSGLDLAAHVSGRCHVVFVTAFDDSAVRAFDEGAVDYVLKPIAMPRLAKAVERLKLRLHGAPADLSPWLSRAAAAADAQPPLRWLQTGHGQQLRLVTVTDVLYFQSDAKYTRVVTREGESHIRMPLKELLARLDAEQFWQIHRGCIVNIAHIASVSRDIMGRMDVLLKAHPHRLAVSQAFQGRFRAM